MTADLHHLAGAYALNALDDLERRAFEAHYPTCDRCAQEVAEFQDVAAALADDASATPPAALKQSVMESIAATRQESPLVRSPGGTDPEHSHRRAVLVSTAAAALILVAGLLLFVRGGAIDPVDEVVDAADQIAIALEATTDDVMGDIEVIWSDELDRVVVRASDLDDPGPGQRFALWFVLDGGVTPAALFLPEAGAIDEAFDVAAIDPIGWGISIEPETGSDQPTTPVIFAGNF